MPANKHLIEELLIELKETFSENVISPRQKIIKFYSYFNKSIALALDEEQQYFPNHYSAFSFIIQKYRISQDYSRTLHALRSKLVGYRKNKSLTPQTKDLRYSYIAIRYFIRLLFGLDKKLSNKINPIIVSKSKLNLVSGKFLVLKRSGDGENFIWCLPEEGEKVKIEINDPWLDLLEYTQKGDSIFCHNLTKSINGLIAGKKSILVYEPDYLFDVTDIAECFGNSGMNYSNYFLSKLENASSNAAILKGNIVNHLFDALIIGDEYQFDNLFDAALKQRPIQSFAFALQNNGGIKRLKEEIRIQFEILKEIMVLLPSGAKSVEPTFISPEYGLQGRLDLLIEYYEDPTKKDIVELKSGKSPSPDICAIYSNQKIQTGVWYNHLAQVSCYNLLLDSNYYQRRGDSSILYSSTKISPRRNVPNIFINKQDVIVLRNKLSGIEKSLALGNFEIFQRLGATDLSQIPSYKVKILRDFNSFYSQIPLLYKDYFHKTIQFIIRESYAGRIGYSLVNRGNPFSDFWELTLEEKLQKNSVLIADQLKFYESDFQDLHIRLSIEPDQSFTFREGDMVILSEINESDEVWRGLVIKASMRKISDKYIVLSIRNKSLNRDVLLKDKRWLISHDYLDTTNKRVVPYIFDLLNSSPKRDILLGQSAPQELDSSGNCSTLIPDYLNQSQKDIFAKAINAKDYFLIQGPPGSGKTSFMLRALVEHFLQAQQSILLIAYTNRAVDEMYKSIASANYGKFAIRLGNKDSSDKEEIMISHLVDKFGLNYTYKKFLNSRIVLSTVASLITNGEVFEIKNFDLAIIDESAQISEYQIVGLLAKVPKFIMIGDHQQLPPIVLHKSQDNSTELLRSRMQFVSPGESLFARLIRLARSNGWSDSYGMLSYQARMHPEIQDFPSKWFYQSKLMCLPSITWSDKINWFDGVSRKSKNKYVKILANHRLIFFDSISESASKINKGEANLVAKLINIIIDNSSVLPNEIGIISPFRAQCALIKSLIDEPLRKLITTDTVERFQGSERRIIILSLGLNKVADLYNAEDLALENNELIDRKLNVAITRAKDQLIIIGNSNILFNSKLYSHLLQHIKLKGYFGSTSELSEQILL